MFGSKREEFALTPDEESFEPGGSAEAEDWQFPRERRAEPAQRPAEAASSSITEIRWGGFFRRALAFLLDLVMIVLLVSIMGSLCYVGYKVGLSAHGRSINLQNSTPLFVFLTFAWVGLATVYFVVFHGMEGKTIGKWLLGLRVVGAERGVITYRQAFLRSLGTIVSVAPLGLGFLWIIWSREKRGWHDFLARTWVIRD
jgi:uncharacterized RDD family membrane protein YckC